MEGDRSVYLLTDVESQIGIAVLERLMRKRITSGDYVPSQTFLYILVDCNDAALASLVSTHPSFQELRSSFPTPVLLSLVRVVEYTAPHSRPSTVIDSWDTFASLCGVSNEVVEEMCSRVNVLIDTSLGALSHQFDDDESHDQFSSSVSFHACVLSLALRIPKLMSFVFLSSVHATGKSNGLVLEDTTSAESSAHTQPPRMEPEHLTPPSHTNRGALLCSLVESHLERLRQNCPVRVLRTACIGPADVPPSQGFVSLKQQSLLCPLIALTTRPNFRFNAPRASLVDVVPLNVVVDAILSVVASDMLRPRDRSALGSPTLPVYHLTTSSRNPLTLSKFEMIVKRELRALKPIKLHKNLLAMGTSGAAERPSFVYASTRYDDSNFYDLWKSLPPIVRSTLHCDVAAIQWGHYGKVCVLGFRRHIAGDRSVVIPDVSLHDWLQAEKRQGIVSRSMSDLRWAVSSGREMSAFHQENGWSKEEFRKRVMQSKRVQTVMDSLLSSGGDRQSIERDADAIFERMAATLTLPYIRGFGYVLRKIWRRLYEGVAVDVTGLQKLRSYSAHGPVVLLPTHRSYMDFLTVSYILWTYNMTIPHIAAGDDFLGMKLVGQLFRNSGAFFIRRSLEDDELYIAIFFEYVRSLLEAGFSIEFFVEATRSRTGKTLPPKIGMLSMVTEGVLEGKLEDVTLVPIHLTYEKVLEGNAYGQEMLGTPKVKESLSALIKARSVLQNSYGRIDFRFGEAVSVKSFQAAWGEVDDRKTFNQVLANTIANTLTYPAICMPTHIVASLLMWKRLSAVTEAELISDYENTVAELKSRNAIVSEGKIANTRQAVVRGIKLLGNLVERSFSTVPKFQVRLDPQSIMTLSWYKNTVIPAFLRDAMVLSALESLDCEVKMRSDVVKQLEFLTSVFTFEFIFPSNFNPEEWLSTVHNMRVISLCNDEVAESPSAGWFVSFCKSLLVSFVDSYCIALSFLVKEQPNNADEAALVDQIQKYCLRTCESQLYGQIHLECASKNCIQNAVNSFVSNGVLLRSNRDRTISAVSEHRARTFLAQLETFRRRSSQATSRL